MLKRMKWLFGGGCFLLLVLLSVPAMATTPGEISTVAGGGIGDGGAATSAGFVSPQGVAVDSSGNLYVADSFSNRIRKVAAGTGILTTVAGNGSQGFSGDGGPATSAALSRPSGVAVDSAGNLYIADNYNNRIRRVAAGTGIITTVAGNGSLGYAGDGGAATSASLWKPYGVAVDSSDNVYIADMGNYCIRKVAVGTGVITTVAGNGAPSFGGDGGLATSASLYYPTDMTVDSAGNLYIADSGNHRVRKVAAGTGIITTVAGTGTQAFSGDGEPAASASLYYPYGVEVDSAGNLYVADTYNHRIRKVAVVTGIITTVAGIGTSGFLGDGGPAASASLNMPFKAVVDASGNVFILDGYNFRIRKVDSGAGIITTVAGNGKQTPDFNGDGGEATAASLNTPFDVTVDSAGNQYIADSYNQRIRRVAAGTGIITTVAGDGTAGSSGDGGQATSARFNTPSAVTLDGDGNLYIADFNNQRIRRVAAGSGIITTVAGNGLSGFAGDGGQATSASLSWPSGMAIDSAGNLFIADRDNQRIRKVEIGTGIITTVAGNGSYAFAGDGGPALSASFKSPQGVAVDSTGNLFISDYYNHRIRKVNAYSGVITTVAGNGTEGFSGDDGPATSASLYSPSGVAVDIAGNLYFSDTGNSRIRKVDAGTGIITTVAGIGGTFGGDGGPATSAGISWPHGVTMDSAGNLFIADSGNHRIRKVIMQGVAAPAVITGAASSISATGATLNGTVNDFVADTTITFDYGLTASYGSSVSGGTVAAGSGKTAVHATITGLACNSTYHFRVVAVNNAGNYNGWDQAFTTGPCLLTVSILGSGGGSVNSDPAGIACASGSSSGCTNSFTNGIPITLRALADWKSTFTGWSAPCNGTGNCTITLNGSGGVSASFAAIHRVRITGASQADYASLQDAYDQAVSSDSLRAKAYTFSENLLVNRPVTFTVDGGWSDNFLEIVGTTTLLGKMTIRQGKATVRKLIIR